jgi:hypothetical protein
MEISRRQVLKGSLCGLAALSPSYGEADNSCGQMGCLAQVSFSQFSADYKAQYQSEWCWAACISMLFGYYGHPVSQQRIVTEAYGAPYNMPAASGFTIAGALNRSWIDDDGQSFQSSLEAAFDVQAGVEMLNPEMVEGDVECQDAVLLMVKSQEARIVELEKGSHKTLLKRLTESASAGALFLGLVLTFVSLHDAFISKPRAERVTRLSQFNQAVNSIAKSRQDLVREQMLSADPRFQLAMMSAATPQIQNNISTAKAMLRDLDNRDVEIPQLLVLISESFSQGDLLSAKSFIERAIGKTDESGFLRSEAKRYEGRYFFARGDQLGGRKSYEEALSLLGDENVFAAARSYVLADLVGIEFGQGLCDVVEKDLDRFVAGVKSPVVDPQSRAQMSTTLMAQLSPVGQRCPPPQNLGSLAPH